MGIGKEERLSRLIFAKTFPFTSRVNWNDTEDVGIVTHFRGKPFTGVCFGLQEYTDDEIVVTFEVDVTEGNQKKKRSRRISQDVKDKVWRRDKGKCVECSSNENLEFDHIIPHSKGGANTYRNIQLLCEKCNRSKSAKIG
ncbi:HNH endonuclease [Flavobacteriaceae bacterium]|nr:HNH endonuclease [Flavobacteriaceae bacterium]